MLRANNLIGFGGRRAAAGGLTPVVWNSADKAANMSLSNGDRTMTATSNASGGARGTVGKSSGKWYFELVQGATVFGSGAAAVPFGIATSGVSLTADDVGADANGAGIRRDCSNYRYNATNTAANPDPGGFATTSAVLMVAFDADAGSIWFGANGTWGGVGGVTGDPGAGTTPSISGLGSGPWFPIAKRNSTNGASITLNASAALCAYAAPSGFSYWGS